MRPTTISPDHIILFSVTEDDRRGDPRKDKYTVDLARQAPRCKSGLNTSRGRRAACLLIETAVKRARSRKPWTNCCLQIFEVLCRHHTEQAVELRGGQVAAWGGLSQSYHGSRWFLQRLRYVSADISILQISPISSNHITPSNRITSHRISYSASIYIYIYIYTNLFIYLFKSNLEFRVFRIFIFRFILHVPIFVSVLSFSSQQQ